MIDYKRKYFKYKEKYLKEKEFYLKQHGGEKTITYSKEIIDFVRSTIIFSNDEDVNNLKESVYSCIYMNMSTMHGNICDPLARTIVCSVLFKLTFPFFTSSGFDMADCVIIEDQLNNNLVIVFTIGSVLCCDHFVKDLFKVFIYIYEQVQELLRKKPEYKFIHIVGHSMGASISTLFSYFIMVVENSTVGNIFPPLSKYFSIDYDLHEEYDIGVFGDGFSDYKRIFGTADVILYDKENNLPVIKHNLDELLVKNYPKIANKISVCVVGGYPVLFRTTDEVEYTMFKQFYNYRYINFGNCFNMDAPITPNIDGIFCDDKLFNIFLFNSLGDTVAELTNFSYTNINNLNSVYINDATAKLSFFLNDKKIVKGTLHYDSTQRGKASELHLYKNNYEKLKKYVSVTNT